MMRLFVLQGCFAIAEKLKIINKKLKMLIIILVVLSFMMKDIIHFLKLRRPNVYEQIGLTRAASVF